MHIVIVGAGTVGSYIAERLSLEGQDIIVIEIDPQRAAEIKERLDVLGVTGNGATASALRKPRSDAPSCCWRCRPATGPTSWRATRPARWG